MKIASKSFLIFLLFFGLSLQSAPNAYSMAQITLQNNTSFWLYLYIDGNFGCGPVIPSGFCVKASIRETASWKRERAEIPGRPSRLNRA